MNRIVALALSLLLSIGCVTTSAPVSAFKVIDSTARAVDVSMRIAGDLYGNGYITEEQKTDIVKAYEVYRSSAKALGTLVKLWNDTQTKPEGYDEALADMKAKAAIVQSKVNR